MDHQQSPYTPGETATFLPGRNLHMNHARRYLGHLAANGSLISQPSVFIGGRGVGKTSLLRYIQRVAIDKGMETIWITAGDSPLVKSLCAEAENLSHRWTEDVKKEVIALVRNVEITIKLPHVDVKTNLKGEKNESSISEAPGSALEKLLEAASKAVKSSGKNGLVIFIDELQSADVEGIRSIAFAWQQLNAKKNEVPAALYAAGLGHTSDIVTEAATFAERFKYLRLKDLTKDYAYSAIVDPAENLGVTWDPGAVDIILDKAFGYPHFIQLYANAAWEAAGDPPRGERITEGAVVSSEYDVQEQLEIFYRNRWSKATKAERELLYAIASQPSKTPKRADVAKSMGKPTTAMSMARRSLMDKGILDSPSRGLLSFTAPGFSDYIKENEGIED